MTTNPWSSRCSRAGKELATQWPCPAPHAARAWFYPPGGAPEGGGILDPGPQGLPGPSSCGRLEASRSLATRALNTGAK